MLMATEVKGLL